MATFADLMADLNLSSVESFGGLFPAGKFIGTVKNVEIKPPSQSDSGQMFSAQLVIVSELKMTDGTTRDYYDYLWIPSGNPQNWSTVAEDGKRSEYDRNVLSMRALRTRLDQLGLDISGKQDPALIIGMDIALTIRHKNDFANVSHAELLKAAPQQQAPVQQQAPQVQQMPQAENPFAAQQAAPAPNPFAGLGN